MENTNLLIDNIGELSYEANKAIFETNFSILTNTNFINYFVFSNQFANWNVKDTINCLMFNYFYCNSPCSVYVNIYLY